MTDAAGNAKDGGAEIQLMPCPFCGSNPIMDVLGGPGSLYRTITCKKCKCDLHFYHLESVAIAAWNTRSNPALAAAQQTIAKVDERIASLTQECAGLRERLAECEWKPITAESLPSHEGIVLRRIGEHAVVEQVDLEGAHAVTAEQKSWLKKGWTHFRPINPPAKDGA